MFSFAAFGNDLHSGRRSIDFIGRRRLWYLIAGIAVLVSILSLGIRGLNAGIEFRGGSEFTVSNVANTSTQVAEDAVVSAVPGAEQPRVSVVGGNGVRVETGKLSDQQTNQVKEALAKAYAVPDTNITSTFVGPSWGQDVTGKAITSLLVFLALVSLVITLYFRTWTFAVAAIVALLHDLLITAGIYALIGFEVTPDSVIGFLTILGYSLYDTVVVFDKVRENTEHIQATTKRTFAEAANLAVNQTLVRSINTSVVALLPVGAILFIGAILLGAGTLKDLALALFVGIAAGTYSSIFIATPLLVELRMREPEMKAQEQRVLKRRREEKERAAEPVLAGVAAAEPVLDAGATAVAVEPKRELRQGGGGQRQQPRRGSGQARNRPGGRRS
ncbi:MAG TPA: protein translocase subunit SecF [Kineosporiaceae bacterium]|nr:protein translocase subunit SecF [Kineosporiaceae bacterium]